MNMRRKGTRFGWQRVLRVLELGQSEVQRERLPSVEHRPEEWSPSEVLAQLSPAHWRGFVFAQQET